MIEQALKQKQVTIWCDLICLHITKVIKYIVIGIGTGNFVADILVIGISVKTHISAPLLYTVYVVCLAVALI